MGQTVHQLRIAATRDGAFLWRAALQPPAIVTAGRGRGALLPVPDPDAPEEHTLFSLGSRSALLEFRQDWDLLLFRDERPVKADRLLQEGTAFRRGQACMVQLSTGSRGSLQWGGTRLLFKWEEIPQEVPADVPLRDLGDHPRCGACGSSLRGCVVKDGLFARCDHCRVLNRFVDPDETGESAGASGRVATVGDERETLLDLPIFAPVTRTHLDPLPELERPAGQAAAPPMPPTDAHDAAEQLRTVLARFPAVEGGAVAATSEAVALPALRVLERRGQPASLDDSFWHAEPEALVPGPITIRGAAAEAVPPVPWRTLSVLSARTEHQDRQGRIPKGQVHRAQEEQRREADRSAARIVAGTGVAVLLVGVLAYSTLLEDGPEPGGRVGADEGAGTVSVGAKPGARASRRPAADRVRLQEAAYVKYLPGDPTPVAVRVAAFSIDRTEVTTTGFRAFLADTGRPPPVAWGTWPPPEDPRQPVTGIAAEEAAAYCAWAGGYLPREDQWERAAAGEGGRNFPWGNSFDASRVVAGSQPEPVGSRPLGASEEGVLDLLGNAVEWVMGIAGGPQLRGGGAGPWNHPDRLQIWTAVQGDGVPWTPGPGFRCAYDPT